MSVNGPEGYNVAMTRPAPIIAGTLAAILLLFGAYMGAYYVLLVGPIDFGHRSNVLPVYRSSMQGTDTVMWPAHRLDRLIRPDYWGDE